MILGPPQQIDAATRAFCAIISASEPLYVRVEPAPDTKVAYCFDNSVAQARLHGGEALYGWAIWHWPGRWFEAEHHAVWRSPTCELVDVTPQTGEPARILFLPDPTAPYDPTTFRANILAPDAGNPHAREYIELVAARSAITRAYWEPGMDILPLFSPEDRARLAPIDLRMGELLAAMR
ncbi:hypothetical protein [Sphingomonas sp. M1-B02]|uniref:hypothetical protein n=1 Tax=Sphingomonas sp. M1-B02 TaxID=3114300 RepID=UPI00223F7916|nr:hypothetical protein [Sphingomonas sp. S6-11]UZK67454.1 hypothetical protein OKW87_06370 [Sphingomonas sp. S6-11]